MTQFAVIELHPAGYWRVTCATHDEKYARDWADCGRDTKRIILKTDDAEYISGLFGTFIQTHEVETMHARGEIIRFDVPEAA